MRKSPMFMLLSAVYLLPHICLVYTSAIISRDEFDAAITANDYPKPSDEVYKYFAEGTAKYPRNETAMFLAQILHESVGLKFIEELACLKPANNCTERYKDDVGLPGKSYHGRGYIQLTWGANYEAASEGLGMGDRLLKNPEVVDQDKRIAMLVSTWYWEDRVRPQLKGKEDQFGATTMAINPNECRLPERKERAQRRWEIYENVADALKIQNRAKEAGCYN